MPFDPNYKYGTYVQPGQKVGLKDRLKIFARSLRSGMIQPLHEIGNIYPFAFQSRWNPFRKTMTPRTIMFPSGTYVDLYGGRFRLRTVFPDGTDHTDNSAPARSVCGTGRLNSPDKNIRRNAVTSDFITLEFVDDNGEWKPMGLVQAFKYEIDIRKSKFPCVTITMIDAFRKTKTADQKE